MHMCITDKNVFVRVQTTSAQYNSKLWKETNNNEISFTYFIQQALYKTVYIQS